MSRVGSPEIEAKNLFDTNLELEGYMFEYFFDNAIPPDGETEEQYLRKLRREYFKFKKESAKRLLGLE